MLCIDFVSFLKGQILRELPNIEKFVIFWKKQDFEKGMHSYVSNVGFSRNLSKRLDLIKTTFPLALKENRMCTRHLLEVTLSLCAQFPLPAHFGKIKQSHTELVFLFLLLLFFCLSLIKFLSLLELFLLCILWNIMKKF